MIHSSFEKSLEVDAVGQQKGEGNFVTHIDIGSMAKPNGVFLTWKDLWVTVPDGKNGSRAILQGLTGYAQPGEVLGPSGCGKSTLLDALAGKYTCNFFDNSDLHGLLFTHAIIKINQITIFHLAADLVHN